MPRFADLDTEQRKIYQGAPPDGSILVVGPPGTGKTVMAFHRATYLKRAGQDPRVIMYNSVLSEYVGQHNSHADGIAISTMHRWLASWFRSLRLGKPPEREAWVPDWLQIGKVVYPLLGNGRAPQVNWGHLIVDEGQDFPPEMYQCLAMLLLGFPGSDATRPALTVFADENQRIRPTFNSTVDEIQRALALTGEKRVFSLTRNYRNTKQVAEFAAAFYCGLRTGIPETPKRQGPRPTVILHPHKPAMIQSIIDFIEATWDQDISIGIVCPKDKTRKYVYSKLLEEYEESEDIVIQSYSSKDEHLSAKDLQFDSGSIVTVLCLESVKGLEFDAVIVIDPFLRSSAAASGQQQFKMNMYVACSRARQHLRLMFVTDREEVLPVLPPKDKGLYELVEV